MPRNTDHPINEFVFDDVADAQSLLEQAEFVLAAALLNAEKCDALDYRADIVAASRRIRSTHGFLTRASKRFLDSE